MALLEGRDFQVLGNQLVVFSREYLLARGTCCGSRCRNCPFEFDKSNRSHDLLDQRPVISMVPSWTETLIAAGANVVGRTRFCVHPTDRVRDIRVLGGTKSLAENASQVLSEINELNSVSTKKPLVVLDKDENPKIFEKIFLEAGCDVYASHVSSLASLETELQKLADLFGPPGQIHDVSSVASNLLGYSRRLQGILKLSSTRRDLPVSLGAALKGKCSAGELQSLNNQFEAVRTGQSQLVYLIWRKPWMCAGAGTFIASVLEWIFGVSPGHGAQLLWCDDKLDRYPEVDLSRAPVGTLFLYSTEPYPFARDFKRGGADAGLLVDGELFSWFGLRVIRYLEDLVAELDSGAKSAQSDESAPF